MGEFEGKVEKGGVLHVPYPEGTTVVVEVKPRPTLTQKEWHALVESVSGSVPDLERPGSWPSRPLKPLD